MNKSIVLFLSLFSFVNSDAFAGKTYALLAEGELSDLSGLQLGRLKPKQLPQKVSEKLYFRKTTHGYQFDLAADLPETSASGQTAVLKINAHYKSPIMDSWGNSRGACQETKGFLILQYNPNANCEYEGSTCYRASLFTFIATQSTPWGMDLADDEVGQALHVERAKWSIEDSVLEILCDDENNISEKLNERMQKHSAQEDELFSENSYQLMKAKVEAQRQKDIEEGYEDGYL